MSYHNLTIDYTINLIFNDPAASNWIKEALKEALGRDAVDAVNDAEVLLKVLKHRVDNILTIAELRRK